MDKIVYIGGIGSSTHQVDHIARALVAKYGKNVVALSFSQARKRTAYLARMVAGSTVITHSAGLLLMKNTTPKELIAVAPPMPTVPSLLVWRSFPKTIALLRSGGESSDRRRRVLNYHLYALGEHLIRPQHNSLMVRQVGAFDAARFAVELVTAGCHVTLVFMENDVLYPDVVQHPHIEIAKRHGVVIRDMILGHHDEVIFYPLEVLAQIESITE